MSKKVEKIHVYFIPGLATGTKIFDFIKLPEDEICIHFLNWLPPLSKDETLQNYAKRMSLSIVHSSPVLVGVSFGGILAQEISKIISVENVILISSVKRTSEMPKRLKWMFKSNLYKLFPSKSLSNLNKDSKIGTLDLLNKKIELFEKYLEVRDEAYLNWAIYNVLTWKQDEVISNVVHIHGSDDKIFPIKHINDTIEVKGGTHEMILTKAKTISNLLQEQILSDES